MKHCTKWMQVLQDIIFAISPNLDLRQMEKLRERNVTLYKMYEEPEFDKDGKFISKRIKKQMAKINDGDLDDSMKM